MIGPPQVLAALSERLPAASSFASRVDGVFAGLLIASTVMIVTLTALTLTFLVRYRRQASVNRAPVRIATWKIETAWTVGTTVVFLMFFFQGAAIYIDMRQVPAAADAGAINVVGRQWMWDIRYPNGRREFNTMHVCVNRPVRLLLSSEDVIHSFFVPAFRLKQDLVPGKVVNAWFEPTLTGTYTLFCAQYCGTAHSAMLGQIIVLSPADYAAWLAGDRRETTDGSPGDAGRRLFLQYGCNVCHSSHHRSRPTPTTGSSRSTGSSWSGSSSFPSIPNVLGNFILPLAIGARDVAFPRLNLASWYIFVAAACWRSTPSSSAGWTPAGPSTRPTAAPIPTAMSWSWRGHLRRGLRLDRHRAQLHRDGAQAARARPDLVPAAAVRLVDLRHQHHHGPGDAGARDHAGPDGPRARLRRGHLRSRLGGDPLLFQHLFWFYSHPAVYIMILPGMGVVSEIITCFARKRIFGYKVMAVSILSIAGLGFLVWGHHMFVSSQSRVCGVVFSLLSFMVSVPSAIKVFNWIATLHRGSITFGTPLLYAWASSRSSRSAA
jgi:cytochrome c oxidase subunit II